MSRNIPPFSHGKLASRLSTSVLVGFPWSTVPENFDCHLPQRDPTQAVLDVGKAVAFTKATFSTPRVCHAHPVGSCTPTHLDVEIQILAISLANVDHPFSTATAHRAPVIQEVFPFGVAALSPVPQFHDL